MSVHRYRYHRKIFYYYRCSIDGKQFSRRLYKGKRFLTEDEARNCEIDFINSHSHRKINRSDYVFMISDEFLSFLEDRYSPGSLYSFIRIWKRFYYDELKNVKISELTSSLFISLNEKINNMNISNRHQYISVGKNFLKFIHRYDIVIDESVFFNSKAGLDFTLKKIDFYTFDEFKKFLNVIDDIYWKFLFSVFYFYGLRIGELRGLRKENINKDKLIVNCSINNKTNVSGQVLSKTKTANSNREFPMIESIWILYNEFLEKYKFDSDFIFCSFNGSMTVGETTIRQHIKLYSSKAKLRYIHPHCFRHSCASLLINNGMDYLQVSSWLGHSSPTVTLNTYSHLFKSRKNDIYTMLNELK